jgi:hypothetical protein
VQAISGVYQRYSRLISFLDGNAANREDDKKFIEKVHNCGSHSQLLAHHLQQADLVDPI